MSNRQSFLRRGRYRLGRWLLRPLSVEIVRHYRDAATEQLEAGHGAESEHCTYMSIGARYVGWKGQHG